jgi:hypothetical protein
MDVENQLLHAIRRSGVEVLDTAPALASSPGAPKFFRLDWHLNDAAIWRLRVRSPNICARCRECWQPVAKA